jgi:hypothetical protein
MTSEESNKSFKRGLALLAHGRKIGANTTERTCSVWAAKGARNLLLDLGHPKISLGLVVRMPFPFSVELLLRLFPFLYFNSSLQPPLLGSYAGTEIRGAI